ncbi:DUF4276 family protein [Actinophytocola glycyrrhizae]|uniref:DUF4276 family protein n=1 Tax=Actinophytocola glycyrrhizae TaxID=2044873 RepID=A0ABV9S6Y0_9PSEU
MTVLEVLVEEPSAKSALEILLPRIVPDTVCEVREFSGKTALMKALPIRFAGYAARMKWEPLKVAVLVDRDDDDCVVLKKQLEDYAANARLTTPATGGDSFQVLNRIVIEELEAWWLGDAEALNRAYPKVPVSLAKQARYRDPDAVKGGTWEALETVLNKHGYHRSGLRKMQAASEIAQYMNVESNRSKSFQVFRDGVRRLVKENNRA